MGLEADGWLCNFIFLYILITHVFEKQTKKRLSLKTQFKTEFLLLFDGSKKVLEKMPGMNVKPSMTWQLWREASSCPSRNYAMVTMKPSHQNIKQGIVQEGEL